MGVLLHISLNLHLSVQLSGRDAFPSEQEDECGERHKLKTLGFLLDNACGIVLFWPIFF